jgi:hypothetical protein
MPIRYTQLWGDISKTVAKEFEHKLRTGVKEGKHLSISKKITFRNFANKYLQHSKINKRPQSARRNGSSINMLMPHFGGN